MINLLSSITDIFANFAKFLSNGMGVWYIVLFNAFGVIAILLKLVEYQFKGRNKNILFCLLAQSCWVVYFLLQGNLASAAASLIGTVSCAVFLQRDKYKWANSVFWLYFFITITVVMGILGFEKWYSVFSLLAAFFAVIAYFVKNPKLYRYIGLLSVLCWLTNSICNGYVLAMICDSTCLISILIALSRMYWFNKDENKDGELTLDIMNNKTNN